MSASESRPYLGLRCHSYLGPGCSYPHGESIWWGRVCRSQESRVPKVTSLAVRAMHVAITVLNGSDGKGGTTLTQLLTPHSGHASASARKGLSNSPPTEACYQFRSDLEGQVFRSDSNREQRCLPGFGWKLLEAPSFMLLGFLQIQYSSHNQRNAGHNQERLGEHDPLSPMQIEARLLFARSRSNSGQPAHSPELINHMAELR